VKIIIEKEQMNTPLKSISYHKIEERKGDEE
jgi:hypothetical protein